jgi:hypothetical protein
VAKREYDNGITFDKKFNKPTTELFLKWWERFSLFNIHDYEYYLVGGFINKKETKDIDIIVKGDINDKLKPILNLAKKTGLKDGLLIDMFWCNNFYDHKNYKPIKKIRNFNQMKITRGDLVPKTYTHNYGGKEILKGLFETSYEKPSKDYFKGKKYKNKYIKIKDFIDGTTNRNSLLQ